MGFSSHAFRCDGDPSTGRKIRLFYSRPSPDRRFRIKMLGCRSYGLSNEAAKISLGEESGKSSSFFAGKGTQAPFANEGELAGAIRPFCSRSVLEEG